MLRDEELGQAFQFGNEATIRNVLEPNWWESKQFQEEQQQVAEEVLRLDQERRRMEEAGEEVEQVKEAKEIKDTGRVVARTRVSARLYAMLTGSCNSRPRKWHNSSRWGWRLVGAHRCRVLIVTEIKILGFQAPDNLSIEDNIKHSYFLYPDEDVSWVELPAS